MTVVGGLNCDGKRREKKERMRIRVSILFERER